MKWARKLRQFAASRPWVGRMLRGMARAGYVGRGVFYLIVAGCALVAAIYARHNHISEPVVLGTLVNHWWGVLVVAAIGLAFACYAVWLMWAGLLLPQGGSEDRRKWVGRTRRFGTALIFVGLALAATGLLFGMPAGRMQAVQTAAEGAMELGLWGRWAVGLIGVVVAGASLVALYHAWLLPVDEALPLDEFHRPVRRTVVAMARVGETARAAVIGLIGFFLLFAAIRNRAGAAQGPTGSLRELEFVPYGPWLLGLIALGLGAYGLYLIVEAWYRRISVGTVAGR